MGTEMVRVTFHAPSPISVITHTHPKPQETNVPLPAIRGSPRLPRSRLPPGRAALGLCSGSYRQLLLAR